MDLLLTEMQWWSKGNWYEKRAAAAALCEPRLLRHAEHAKQALKVIDRITESMARASDGEDEPFRVLRQAMGYCWSVAVAAVPEAGMPLMEKWLDNPNHNIRWIMKENLKKNRLIRIDGEWVKRCNQRLEQNAGSV